MSKTQDGLAIGSAFLILSKVIFLISGYAVNILAARILGPSSYGIVGIIISIMTLMNIFFLTGFPRATSKYLSENKKWDKNLIKKAKKLQIIFLTISTIIYILISPLIANSYKPYFF